MSRQGYRPGAGPGTAGGVPFDMDDVFGQFFGGGGRGRRAQRGADLETRVTLSFDDAYRGVTLPVRLNRDVACSACNGSGDASGRAQTCSACGGAGVTNQSQGMFSFARPCDVCAGSGRAVSTPCARCHGAGIERIEETVKVKIPAGIKDGARIRVRGRGGAARGAPAGDLFVVVTVEPHPTFARKGNDLTMTVPITYPAAALGAQVKVPTMNGPVTLKIPAGTQPGKTFRVRGKGMPNGRGSGDLLVTVQVDVPTKLSDDERELIEKLASIRDASEGASHG